MGTHGWRTSRRAFVRAGGTLAGVGLAGCTSGGDAAVITPTSADGPDPDADRAVYVPPHVHSRTVAGTTTSGGYAFGLAFSVPDYYWTVDGASVSQVTPAGRDNLQLLATVWDPGTGLVLPHLAVQATVETAGDQVIERPLVPLLNQRWGLHAVANVAIDRYGDLTVRLEALPTTIRRTGEFRGRLDGPARATLDLDYTRTAEQGLETLYSRFSGTPGAFRAGPPGGIPLGRQSTPADRPGTVVGRGTSDDAAITAAVLPADASPLADGRPYLAVSVATPYNRFVLPTMHVRGRLVDGDEIVFEDDLVRTIDPVRGYHYGTAVDRLDDATALRLSFPTPPQVARYEGYERAFRRMGDVELPL